MEVLNDILGYKNRKIYQNSNYFSFSLDSVLLANYVHLRMRDKRILDMCSGNAVIPLILSLKTNILIDAVEIQKEVFDLGKKSILFNHLEEQISFFCDDVKNFSYSHIECYDVITCNPPYFKSHPINQFKQKSFARHEITLSLEDFLQCSSRMLKNNGNLFFVHRAERFEEIILLLHKYHLSPKRIQFVYPNIHKNCLLVLIEAQKCGKIGMKFDSPFFLYNEDGTFSDNYQKIIDGVIECVN